MSRSLWGYSKFLYAKKHKRLLVWSVLQSDRSSLVASNMLFLCLPGLNLKSTEKMERPTEVGRWDGDFPFPNNRLGLLGFTHQLQLLPYTEATQNLPWEQGDQAVLWSEGGKLVKNLFWHITGLNCYRDLSNPLNHKLRIWAWCQVKPKSSQW